MEPPGWSLQDGASLYTPHSFFLFSLINILNIQITRENITKKRGGADGAEGATPLSKERST